MNFSELSLAERETGLSYDESSLSLSGKMRGFGVVVSDANGEYTVKIFADQVFRSEKTVIETVNRLGGDLPKNAVISQRCEYGHIEIRLCKNLLLQENLPLLIDFLFGMTNALAEAGIGGKAADGTAPVRTPAEKAPEQTVRKNSFGLGSVKGLAGAVIGAAAMIFIASALIKPPSYGGISSALSGIGSYILTAAAVILIFFDYHFLARKLDPFGIIICPVISVLCAVSSALLVTAKAYAERKEMPLTEAFMKIDGLFEADPELASFGAGYLVTGIVISVFMSVICCMWYFRKHPDEMVKQ